MTVQSEFDLMLFISQTYHNKKAQLGTQAKTVKVFDYAINHAYSLYAAQFEFKTESQIKSAFNKWKKDRKKGVKPTTPPAPTVITPKIDLLRDPLVEEIERYNLHPETYF